MQLFASGFSSSIVIKDLTHTTAKVETREASLKIPYG